MTGTIETQGLRKTTGVPVGDETRNPGLRETGTRRPDTNRAPEVENPVRSRDVRFESRHTTRYLRIVDPPFVVEAPWS